VNNTAGFQTGDEKVLVCIQTSAGGRNPMSNGQPFIRSIAYDVQKQQLSRQGKTSLDGRQINGE